MTYKTGSIGEFMAWTKQVIHDPAKAKGVPKHWFDAEETALQSESHEISAEAMAKLLSPENLAVLLVISREKPGSLRQLAELTGRKESNPRLPDLGRKAFGTFQTLDQCICNFRLPDLEQNLFTPLAG